MASLNLKTDVLSNETYVNTNNTSRKIDQDDSFFSEEFYDFLTNNRRGIETYAASSFGIMPMARVQKAMNNTSREIGKHDSFWSREFLDFVTKRRSTEPSAASSMVAYPH
jgi:hypothetical protein